ncbi:glycosyltransferase family 4 protein [Patescibacteria group bacterium]|nr:glycosyltransferase family 4 protein [Patescibacteria group bacterium]
MKIGVLIDRLNVGGVEKTAIQEVKAAQKLGVNTELLVLSRKSVVEGAHEDLLGDLPIQFLDDRLPGFLKFTFGMPGFAFFSLFHITYPIILPFFIKSREWDHIISHGSYTTLSALGIKFLRKIPFSIYFWDPIDYIVKRVYIGKFPKQLISIYTFFGRFFDRLFVKEAEYVFVAGDTHNSYLSKYVGLDKITVVNPGTPVGKPEKKEKHVLMVTTWKEGKHPEYVFELARKLPGVKFKLVGGWVDSGMRRSFEKKRDKLGLDDYIELCGEANEGQLAYYYPRAAVHLTTNLEKGFGMPVLEAAACGTVSIVPKGSGVCSVFEHGVDAFYSEERNTEEIVSYIKSMIDDMDKAKEMGLKAYNRVKESYTWEAHTKKILKKIGAM